MAEIKKVEETINITTDITECDFNKILKKICLETGGIWAYVGERINKQRSKMCFTEHEGEFYYVSGYSGTLGKFSVQLKKFEENFEETEPISNYKYCLEHHEPNADSDICFYYKEDELEQAKKAQEFLGKDIIQLYEI